MESTPDPVLLSLVAARNRNALRELRFRYGPTAYAAAYSVLADPEKVEWAVSDAFGRAWRGAIDRIPDGTAIAVAAWICELVQQAARRIGGA
jgi:DNA-directed RNA polymerase specialized sigma24 family protein